jgi:choline dehydrogenase
MAKDSSYEFENFLPYFRKSVHYTPPQTEKRPANASVPEPNPESYSSNGGPLEVGYINYPLPFGSWTKLAFEELGFNETSDFNHGELVGKYQYLTQTIAPDMTRSSSQASYLDWQIHSARQNLQTYTRTLAKRIIFNQTTATGVEVTTFGIPYIISATREVILSAGAIQSPQLLMVSGIGPRQTLEDLSISVLVDLPGVGQNLWDHVLFPVTHKVNLQQLGSLTNPLNYLSAAAAYRANRTGPLTNTGFDFVAWAKLPTANLANLSQPAQNDLSSFPSDWPTLEFIIGDASNPNDTEGNSYSSVIGALVSPLSRGNITILSNDTSDLPLFNPDWLSHPTDQEVAVQAFKRCREVFATSALAPVLIGDELIPGVAIQTDEQILQFLKAATTSVYHAACTCKMGTRGDEMAVIDSRARVFGVEGLRVVDASSFPVLVPGHPMATIYALAEKIAADILGGR